MGGDITGQKIQKSIKDTIKFKDQIVNQIQKSGINIKKEKKISNPRLVGSHFFMAIDQVIEVCYLQRE